MTNIFFDYEEYCRGNCIEFYKLFILVCITLVQSITTVFYKSFILQYI